MLLSSIGGVSAVLLFGAVLAVLLLVVTAATVVGTWRRYVASSGQGDDDRDPQDL